MINAYVAVSDACHNVANTHTTVPEVSLYTRVLDMAIENLNVVKEISSITRTDAIFGLVSVISATIEVYLLLRGLLIDCILIGTT